MRKLWARATGVVAGRRILMRASNSDSFGSVFRTPISNVRAAFASCLPCFTALRSESASNPPSNALNASLSEPCSTSTSTRPFNDLEHLLRDSDSDAVWIHTFRSSTNLYL